MLHTEALEPIGDRRWQDFVDRSATGGIFHHVEWLRLLRDQYGYGLEAWCAIDGDGEIVAGLPFARVYSRLTGRRLVAVPFADICGPVLQHDGGEPQGLAMLLEAVRCEGARDGLKVEVRAPIEGFSEGGSFYHHELRLPADAEALRSGFSKGVKSGISRARREGIEVRFCRDRESLDRFYELHARTRRRLGVPTQPKRFVGRFAGLFEQELGFVALACAGERPVAAAVFLAFNGVLTYKYGASDPAHLKLQPNNAMLMEAIRWGCEHGLHTLDFGRTDLDNDGLRAFKRGWGASERRLTYTYLSPHRAHAGRAGVPPAVRRIIASTPPLTGRIVGAALYRHFG
jgi:CelD/BcsL family acetyltransferase involved in cellulose biosynthesis